MGGYYLPVVDEETCTHCGLCADICPGAGFRPSLLDGLPSDPFTGNALAAYVGKATDKQLFENSQSGGIVSALLVHSLEAGRINGAAVVSMEAGMPPRPLVRVARTSQDIYQAQKSKYCPVPLLSFLRDLKKEEWPVAVVGISCQIHGLRNILDKLPQVENKIAFTIGLVCDRVLTYAALDYLVSKSGTDKKVGALLHFRDKSVSGYPGDVHVLSDSGKSVVMPSSVRMRVKDYFTPARCRICFDKMNVFSDITVADPHGLNNVDKKLGESVLVVRTEPGRDIIQSAKHDRVIDIRRIQYEQVLRGQRIGEKREQWSGYTEAWKKSGRKLPNYYEPLKSHTQASRKNGKYLRDMQYSLGLDEFSSRDELIGFVERTLKKKQLVNTLVFPIRLGKQAIRRILTLIV